MMKKILETRVSNRPGVLDRIVGLIRRRGWNIGSLTVGELDGSITQITMLLEGRDIDIDSLGEYLDEMDAVHSWRTLTEQADVLRELLLFCMPDGQAVPEGARVIRAQGGVQYCEVTDMPSGIDTRVQALHAQGISCVRSGPLPYYAGGEDA